MKRIIRNSGPLFVVVVSAILWAQTPSQKSQPVPSAILTFTFDHPELDPNHYELGIDSNCQGTYKDSSLSTKDSKEHSDVSIAIQLKLSASTCSHLFELTRSLNYLSGNYDYTKARIAFNGKKTISYSDANHNNTTSLNWSENAKMMELVEIFQGICATLLLGRQLDHMYKYQILGLDRELAKAEGMLHDGFLKELSLIQGPLKTIAEDPRVVNIARQRARRLLMVARG